MTGLDTLPLELIREIISHLTTFREILTFSLVCRHFYHLIDPSTRQKYHRIRLTTDSLWYRAYRKLEEICETPYLGQYVHEFQVLLPLMYQPRDYRRIASLPDNCSGHPDFGMCEMFKAMMGEAGFDDEDVEMAWAWVKNEYNPFSSIRRQELIPARRAPREWRRLGDAVKTWGTNAVVVALISKSPNIKVLKIHNIWPCQMLGQFLKRINNSHSGYLQKLVVVNICFNDRRGTWQNYHSGINLLSLMRFFDRLPNVKTISINNICSTSDCSDSEYISPGTSNFRNIRINHSNMPSSHLADIIRQPRILEEFTYTIGGRRFSYSAGPEFIYPTDLREALLPRCGTLQMLNLDVDADLKADNGGELAEESLPNQFAASLRSFTALTHLSIGVDLLLGKPSEVNQNPQSFQLHDILPPNLEQLAIRGYKAGECQFHTDQISSLRKGRDERSRLKRVTGIDEPIPRGVHRYSPDTGPDIEYWVEECDWATEPEEFDWKAPRISDQSEDDSESHVIISIPPPCLFNFYMDDGYSSGSRYAVHPRRMPNPPPELLEELGLK
ncbi:hypothetical protein MGYG_00248 [Nannizzia gypsea CBS 118893]|uniref:F-box domain-containing protein n=1 Tax=Arthroderma gypseum (strain ATCC MYA-4604 / CBS 118893) TaxID=535722 RepID=E5QYB4_ARTGP|nr:hypothetical protein MGYG_00248 [Nannizzia gypsea CBS 118893]EFQ97206.1 hypothetical protein MGYG_00248 [Nannizzia gypsea CBS 118893]